MSKGNEQICSVCKEKNNREICDRYRDLIKNGASEEAVKRMLSDKETNKVWEENKHTANILADAYYESILDEFKGEMKKSSKETFGYNTFAEGITIALDIIMPMLDKESRAVVKRKIDMMISARKKHVKGRK